MATADEYAAWIVKNAGKKGTPDFDTVVQAYKSAQDQAKTTRVDALKKSNPGEYDTASPEYQAKYGATSGMGNFQKFAAGYGSAIPTMAMGIGQRLGLVDQSTVDEHKQLMAPLMATKAGMAGSITGNVAAAVPTAFIPGVNTVAGGAAVGAGLGAIQPTSGDESVLKNTAMGGALGGGAVAAGQLLGAGYRGVKALIEPFTAAGPQKIAGRTIQRFATDPASVANVTNKPTVTGALPTLAEQTGDVGLARMQDALRSADPQLNNALATRASLNNASRVNALRGMAGEDGARDFAVAERAGTAGPMYKEAFNVVPDAAGLTAEQSRTMATLMKSPAIQSAMSDARAIAANRGTNVGPSNATGSVEGLHNMKMALDDAISAAKTAGNTQKAASIQDAQKRLVSLIEDISPEYKNARDVYASMSKPINQMDVAKTLADKVAKGGSDLTTGVPIINRNALMNALANEPALIKQATGRPVANALSDVMSPEQMTMLNAIRSEADRAGAVATAGNGPGSATAQRLASQNILRQTIAPNGTGGNSLAQKAGSALVENTLANTLVGKATNWLYSGIAEPKIQQALAKAVLEPEEARAAIAAAKQQGITLPDNLMTRLLGQARRVTGVSSANSTRQP